MMKPGEFVIAAGGIVSEDSAEADGSAEQAPGGESSGRRSEDGGKAPKFAMIFNRYNSRLNLRATGRAQEDKTKDRNGSKYAMIFNKDVTVRSKPSLSQSEEAVGRAATDPRLRGIESELNCMRLNDAETLMNLYGRSNLFIPELTISGLSPGEEGATGRRAEAKRRANDPGVRMYNSLTSLSRSGKGSSSRRSDVPKSKISSLTCLETHAAREVPRKHVSALQERKLFRVRSLDLSESVTSSDSDLDRSHGHGKSGSEDGQSGSEPRKSDKKSRGDSVRRGDRESGGRKQVQWKSEVDVIYFESHQAADGDRSGEILGRVMEPLREEWEQQRTGFYAKMVPLSLGSHLNERWQSLLKI